MEINELKKNMSVLEQVLAKTNVEVDIDRSQSETAQMRLIKTYRQSARKCLFASIIPFVLLMAETNPAVLPIYLKVFLLLYLLTGAAWYFSLLVRTKRIDIGSMSPIELFSSTSIIRLYTLSGEIFFTVTLAIFFSLFLSNMWSYNPLITWLTIGILIIGVTFTLTYYIPKLIRIFRELESIK